MTRELLLISNSTMHGGDYLAHCDEALRDFLGGPQRVAFIPYALADHDRYEALASAAFKRMGHELESVHRAKDPAGVVQHAQAIFVGGGNTFRLLNALYETGLLEVIRGLVFDGLRYIGSSAGTNVATPSIRTTNDMPILMPPSFEALGLVPFQINPHYLDPDTGSTHMGETREERINQFHEENRMPVLGLREGGILRISGDTARLQGTTPARLFRRGRQAVEFQPSSDLSFLLQSDNSRR